MIEEGEYIFVVLYAILVVVVCVAMIKVQSTETVTITTPEFKSFQQNFLLGYMIVVTGEVLSVASFYQVLSTLDLNLTEITDLFVAGVASSTVFGLIAEAIDIGSRRDKCIISAVLYAVATFSLFSGGHFEVLMLGRVVYGAASVLLHSAFDAYMVHEHTSRGFPDDWLLNTFGKVVHSMTGVAILSGFVGQTISSLFGVYGIVGLCVVMFASITVFISTFWNKDMINSRFMLSGFLQSVGQTVRTIKSSKQMLFVVLISVCSEASIIIFSFYWAPWLEISYSNITSTLPYILIYSTLMMSSMLGNYLYTLLSSTNYGSENIFQIILTTSTAASAIGAIMQSPQLVLFASVLIQLCTGAYWPSIGLLRGRYFLPELRGIIVALSRSATLECISFSYLFFKFIFNILI
jgi:MFS family permease